MRTLDFPSVAIAGLGLTLLAGAPAVAAQFTCADILLNRTMSDTSEPLRYPYPKETRLHLDIDEANPVRSSLRWSGDPNMEGVTSRWPDTTRITVRDGMTAVSFSTARDGIRSVGTLTLDANGRLRVAESTLSPQPAVIFDVLEATCHPGTE